MIYAFVDTNIFVRIATQGRPGCEQKHFDDLRTLVENGTFRLLVPEVVSLEVQKNFRSLPKAVESACDKLSDAVGKATQDTWSEIDALKVEMQSRIMDFKQVNVKDCQGISSHLLSFLHSEHVTPIPLTAEILVSAKRRLILGMMPNCKKSSDQDALIVESLIQFFRSNTDDVSSIFFCTENTNDFALEVKTSGRERHFVLDPQIQKALPSAHFSTDLASMLAEVKGFEELPVPTSEQIENAIKVRDSHDVEDEEYGELQQTLTESVYKEYASHFDREVLPSMPPEIRALRERLTQEVRELFIACRSSKSWGDRSEYKLPQWIESVDESMIPYTSLPKLIRIKNSLQEYLAVHKKMDRDRLLAEQ